MADVSEQLITCACGHVAGLHWRDTEQCCGMVLALDTERGYQWCPCQQYQEASGEDE